jgi:hypothetical protein
MSAPLTRRQAIFGAVASSAALAVPVTAIAAESALPPGWVDFAPPQSKGRYAYFEESAQFGLARFEILARRHREAEARIAAASEADDDEMVDTACDVAEAALLAICAYRPFGYADDRARAEHLHRWLDPSYRRGNELERHHQLALLESIGRFESKFYAKEAT